MGARCDNVDILEYLLNECDNYHICEMCKHDNQCFVFYESGDDFITIYSEGE